jgi:hypothetical protein
MRRTTALLAAGTALLAVGWPTAAVADETYRTQKYPLMAVGGAAEARGSVINVHANGPVVYGQERYQVAGAAPSTTYGVTLELFADAGCTTTTGLLFDTASLTTNRAGVGQAKATFFAQEVATLVTEPATVWGVWRLSAAGVVAYQTGCQAIDLDVPPPLPPGRGRA